MVKEFLLIVLFLIKFIMWHEARKQEKKIRSMMVDHQKRADRRRQFYEKIVSIYEW